MNKQELISALANTHRSFTDYVASLPDEIFMFSWNSKWTPGQHLDHMVRSVRPVALAFMIPNFMLRLLFGKLNRPKRSFEEIVLKYNKKLADGARATGVFVPPAVPLSKRNELVHKLNGVAATLASRVSQFPEEDLDHYLLPHPVLGKLTMREMIYFTVYHVQHHHKNLKSQLENMA